jgi:hypothetical protein
MPFLLSAFCLPRQDFDEPVESLRDSPSADFCALTISVSEKAL